jgi:hypothetical protein
MTQTAADLPVTGRLPWGTTSEGELTTAGTVVGGLMGTFAVLVTFPLGVLGIVLSCLGLDRIARQEPSARRFLMWSWICFVPGTLVGVPLLLLLIASSLRSLLT